MRLPENAPRWLTSEMLERLPLDSATCLGFELRAGMTKLSRQALKELERHFPRESGLAAQGRQDRIAELDAAEAELDRARNEIDIRRAALRADGEND